MANNLGNKQTMAQNIQFYMNKKGKSRKDMCEALGISYMTFSDWVNAKTYPRIDKIEMMAHYFGISKSDLVEERNDQAKKELPESSSSGISDTVKKLYPQLTQDEQHLVDEMIISLARKKG